MTVVVSALLDDDFDEYFGAISHVCAKDNIVVRVLTSEKRCLLTFIGSAMPVLLDYLRAKHKEVWA